jgi:hypothetical protein
MAPQKQPLPQQLLTLQALARQQKQQLLMQGIQQVTMLQAAAVKLLGVMVLVPRTV